MIMVFWTTAIGVIGLIIIIADFLLEATGKFNTSRKSYVLLYMIGALCLTIYAYLINTPIFIILNAVAFLLAFITLLRLEKLRLKK